MTLIESLRGYKNYKESRWHNVRRVSPYSGRPIVYKKIDDGYDGDGIGTGNFEFRQTPSQTKFWATTDYWRSL